MKQLTRLEKFLINRELLEKFEHNLKKIHKINIDTLYKRYDSDRLILNSFDWMTTKEGYLFWSRVNREWVKSSDKL